MKLRVLYIVVIGVLFSCNSNPGKKNATDEMDEVNMEELEKKGFEIYQKIPKNAIPIFKQVALEYEKIGDFKKAGLTNLNVSNIYDEYLNKVDSALFYSEKSLNIWIREKDSMQMANLYKYIGLLKGKKGQFEEAKSSIQKAITIYISQGFGQGVAVSEINLADVYFREKEYEESIVYFNKSKKFWMDNDDKSRIYTDNILGIRIFAAINRDELVESLINENRKIEHEIEVNGFVKTKFDEVINEIKIEVSH